MKLIDTNVLLDYPEIIKNNLNDIVLSIRVIEELDRLKDSQNIEKAVKARKANREILRYIDDIQINDERFNQLEVDNALVHLAKSKEYTLISNDLPVLIYCQSAGVSCEEYHKEKETYSGVHYKNIILDDNLYNQEMDEILQNKGSQLNLKMNEFLICKDEKKNTSFLFRKNAEGLIPIDNKANFANNFMGRIFSRNEEQACLLNLLFDENISILAALGNYGTGKSFLLTNYALHALTKGKINKIVYVPNNSIVKDARELGTLPGEMIDKELSYMGPILDLIGEFQARDMINRGQIEIVPLSVIRGRSFENSIILVNEAQNLTQDHIKLLIGRCADKTRIFFDGDIKQTDKDIFKNKNGIELLLKLADNSIYSEIFGVVKLKNIERSKTAQASEYLDNLS